ncbi:MAG: class I adenylate-forming enzyme family protein [Thermoplasmata archaeon]
MAWLNIGESLRVNASKYPGKMALKDERRALTFSELNIRVNKLANALLGMGLRKGDKLGIISYNCIEFLEVYLAAAKSGVIVVPLNWRQTGKAFKYILTNSDTSVMVVHSDFVDTINEIKDELLIAPDRYICLHGEPPEGYIGLEQILRSGSGEEPDVDIANEDTWVILYTSGTTGVPKGVVRSHRSYIAFYLINEVEFSFRPDDYGLIVMPLFHVNSTFYSFVFTYIGASVYVHKEKRFNPEEVLQIIDSEKITFTSLIPTHYNLILSLPGETKAKYDVSSMRSILCSSAPVWKKTKLEIMDFFKGSKLFEAYGSTEAGLVTLLRPEDQLDKLGSIGKECIGTDTIRLLDDDGREVPIGEVGELYSRGPMMFDCYYKNPEKTRASFVGEYFSAGDMARRDEDGYYTLVDRKDNMIITGGEHVFPSEVEALIGEHEAVRAVAIIGEPHVKWGEAVTAVVVLKDGKECTEEEIIEFCRGRMAAFKKPKRVRFITEEEMPRTPTGKILHRVLRERFCGSPE